MAKEREHEACRDSGLDDFYGVHGICVGSGGHGKLVLGVRWRDEDGIEQSEKGAIASLVARHGLDAPRKWLSDALRWDYLYETCGSCKGLGHSSTGNPDTTQKLIMGDRSTSIVAFVL